MNTKISDAIKRLERACIAGMDEEFRDDVQAVLNHLAADAVPAGYRWRHSAGEKWQYSDVPCGWEHEPLFAHPQPAALNEVSGNSGELGGEQEALDIDDVRELFEEWAKGRDLTPNTWGSTSYENVSVDNDWLVWVAAWKALAATGKQQGGEVQGDGLATLQQDYDNLLAAFDRQVAAAEKIATTALEQDDRIEELEEALAARQPVVSSVGPGPYLDEPDSQHHPLWKRLRSIANWLADIAPNCHMEAAELLLTASSIVKRNEEQPAQGIDLSPIATRKLTELAAQGYVTNGVAIFNPATGQRGLVDNLGFVGWMGAQGIDLGSGIEVAAKFIQEKADDYAEQHGYNDMGALSFGSGHHAEVKTDHHFFMVELVDELRALIDSQRDAGTGDA